MAQTADQTIGFPCTNCGAKLQFDPSVHGMACPFCGFKQELQNEGIRIRDIPLEEGMQQAAKGLGAPVTTVQCKGCGATVNVGQGERTTTCAFCGSTEVLSLQTNEEAIRPESVVPFNVSKDDANKRFGAWLGGLWFRPSDLKRIANVQEMGGVYVPFWTYTTSVSSTWTAERGRYYYEEERVGQEMKRVQKTRWEPASGSRQDQYKDVLVCAGRGLPTELADKFSTFDTNKLTPYRPEYLAGWRAEAYALDLIPGWQKAQSIIHGSQEQRCGRDVGGDTHRGLVVHDQFFGTAFKHVLLPVWIAAYRYNDKVYQFLVNGQTGEVVGKAPWSVLKITAFVIFIAAIVGVILYLTQVRGR